MLSKRLKLLREEHHISQKELARTLGLSQQTIAKYETDKATPNPDTLKAIVDYFGVTADYLLGRTDNPNNLSNLDDDILAISRAAQKMSPDERRKMMNILKASFEKEFESENDIW